MAYGNRKMGLALSGGGFRAALFGLGSLWRLNELGLLESIDRITSVSGGSILAGFLGYCWKSLRFQEGVAQNFGSVIVKPLRDFCSHTIDIPSGLAGILLPFKSAGDFLTSCYDKELFHGATIRDLPIGPGGTEPATGPDFVIYATNMQTGRNFRFTQEYVADYFLGINRKAVFPLATAVAASSAFPPVFSPITINANHLDWKDAKLKHPELAYLQRNVVLADGGIYDNMGLEALIDNVDITLVSDAGASFKVEVQPKENYFSQLGRVRDILIEQTRSLRKRWFVQDLDDKKRKGAYWGIGTQIGEYHVPTIVSDSQVTEALQSVRTRLNKFSDEEQGQIINWGYALCDAAIRRYVVPSAPQATKLPVPEHSL